VSGLIAETNKFLQSRRTFMNAVFELIIVPGTVKLRP